METETANNVALMNYSACKMCGVKKEAIDAFFSISRRTDRCSSVCIECKREQWRAKAKKFKARRIAYMKKYRAEKAKELNAYHKAWSLNNEQRKQWKVEYTRARNLKGANRIVKSIHNACYSAIRGYRKTSKSFTLLGIDVEGLKKHLESLFDDGMSWDNYGRIEGVRCWHIDHIIPVSMFDLMNSEEQECCFHYTNLQPMWADQNCSKNNRWVGRYEDKQCVNLVVDI